MKIIATCPKCYKKMTSQNNSFVCSACNFVQYKDAYGMPIAPDYAALSQPQYTPQNPYYAPQYPPQDPRFYQQQPTTSAQPQSTNTQPQETQKEQASPYKKCPYCSILNYATASFCSGCRNYMPQVSPAASAVQPAYQPTQQPHYPQPYSGAYQSDYYPPYNAQQQYPNQYQHQPSQSAYPQSQQAPLQSAVDTTAAHYQYHQPHNLDYIDDIKLDPNDNSDDSATQGSRATTLTAAQKNLYFGIGFIAAMLVATLLLLSLNFAQVRTVPLPGVRAGVSIPGFFVLIGLFGGVRGFEWARMPGYSYREFGAMRYAVNNTASLWIAAIFMLLLFGIKVWLLVDCIRLVIKKQNITESNFFFIRMFTLAGLYILLFIFSLVINSQISSQFTSYLSASTGSFTFMWLPIMFFAAAFVVAYIVLFRPNANTIDKSFDKFRKNR